MFAQALADKLMEKDDAKGARSVYDLAAEYYGEAASKTNNTTSNSVYLINSAKASILAGNETDAIRKYQDPDQRRVSFCFSCWPVPAWRQNPFHIPGTIVVNT